MQTQRQNQADDGYGGAVFYSNDALVRFNTVLISVLSATLPVLSIVALYFIQTTLKRIGAVVAFTIVFAFTLAMCTEARRLEIFASTST